MRRRLLDFDWTTVTLVVAWFMFVVAGCPAQLQHRPSATQDSSLKKFLQNYEGSSADEVSETRYSAAFVDLRENGAQQVIVYLTGNWCGTGGCTMLILAPEGTSYKVVTKTTVTRLPIRMLATKSNGWHDISVVARTNGVEPLYDSILSFDGKTYPGSPPARRLGGKVEGKIVIPVTADDIPLYQ